MRAGQGNPLWRLCRSPSPPSAVQRAAAAAAGPALPELAPLPEGAGDAAAPMQQGALDAAGSVTPPSPARC